MFWMSQNIIMVLFSDPCLNQKLDLRSIKYSGIAWPFLNRQMLVWIGSHSSIWQIYCRGWKRNHESSDSEKSSTKYTYELIAFDQGNAGYGVSESPIFNPRPLYNSCIRGWQSACFSSNLVLNVQLQKNSMRRQNEWWYQVWMKQKFEHQIIQNETKLSLRKSLNQ